MVEDKPPKGYRSAFNREVAGTPPSRSEEAAILIHFLDDKGLEACFAEKVCCWFQINKDD
jgi:hypothetical protein